MRRRSYLGGGAGVIAGTALAEKPVETPLEPDPSEIDHNRDWMRAMRGRKDPNAPVEAGYSHSVISIMGHISADIGKRVAYDTARREIVAT